MINLWLIEANIQSVISTGNVCVCVCVKVIKLWVLSGFIFFYYVTTLYVRMNLKLVSHRLIVPAHIYKKLGFSALGEVDDFWWIMEVVDGTGEGVYERDMEGGWLGERYREGGREGGIGR